MRCERCGAELSNKIVKVNGITYCDNCIKELGFDRYINDATDFFASGFGFDEIPQLMQLKDLDFGNNNITCPKCGTSLREFENMGFVGCIECYLSFSDSIVKEMLKNQGDSEYAGRLPGTMSHVKFDNAEALDTVETVVPKKKKAEPKAETKTEKKPVKDDDKLLEVLSRADLGTVSDEDLDRGMRLAASRENYILAKKLRDELMGRKGGN